MAMLFVALMSYESAVTYFAAFVLFIAAVLTDWYDGKIARACQMVTNFGKLLDPVADKVLMAAGFIMLMTIPELRIPGWAIVAIFAREFLVTGMRALAASEGMIIPANGWGKLKTIFQMTYVATFVFLSFFLELLRYEPLAAVIPGSPELYAAIIGWASFTLVAAVALYTVATGVQFTLENWHRLNLEG